MLPQVKHRYERGNPTVLGNMGDYNTMKNMFHNCTVFVKPGALLNLDLDSLVRCKIVQKFWDELTILIETLTPFTLTCHSQWGGRVLVSYGSTLNKGRNIFNF